MCVLQCMVTRVGVADRDLAGQEDREMARTRRGRVWYLVLSLKFLPKRPSGVYLLLLTIRRTTYKPYDLASSRVIVVRFWREVG